MLTKPWERRLAGLGIACFGVGNFVLSVHFDLIGRLYDFSRDGAYGFLSAEAILLAVNLTPVVLLGLVLKTVQLKSALKSQAATEAKAIRISLTDPLTGLGNRRALFRHIESLAKINWRRSEGHVTTMIVDLDRFKPVNDLHGHAIGDAVLVEVARRIERQLSADDFVARLGGDEFAIVLRKGSTISRCEALADLIIKAVSKPFGKGITAISVGASIGISRSPIKDASDRCLTTADQALYVAKRSGRGSFAWYSDKLETAARQAALLEADLRKAIASDEIRPFFQPIIQIGTGKIKGLEVLARWNHPTRGNVPPSTFIPIAETAGIIGPLGWSIMRQACEAACKWDDDLVLSVNISPLQFRDRRLVENVYTILVKTGFEPSRLELEITESAVIDDPSEAYDAISRLQALGVSVALDDFGTGFASLSNLRRLPFDRLKIDKSFVSQISQDSENQRIVSGIVDMAKGLNLEITVEGIERDEDLAYLKDINGLSGQGFLFSKPLSAEDTAWHLETRWSETNIATETVISIPAQVVQKTG